MYCSAWLAISKQYAKGTKGVSVGEASLPRPSGKGFPSHSVLTSTQGERDGVYEAVIHLVETRLQKAQSLRGS